MTRNQNCKGDRVNPDSFNGFADLVRLGQFVTVIFSASLRVTLYQVVPELSRRKNDQPSTRKCKLVNFQTALLPVVSKLTKKAVGFLENDLNV